MREAKAPPIWSGASLSQITQWVNEAKKPRCRLSWTAVVPDTFFQDLGFSQSDGVRNAGRISLKLVSTKPAAAHRFDLAAEGPGATGIDVRTVTLLNTGRSPVLTCYHEL